MKNISTLPKRLEKFAKVVDSDSIIVLKGLNKECASYWLQLKSESGTVEGKLHLAKNGGNKLIIFEPGFPGDGSTRLERLWLNKLLGKSFDVFAVRHNGIIINGEFSDNYLYCKEKQLKAKEQQQIVLGSNPPPYN